VVNLGSPLQINDVCVRNRVFLAPMSGVTDYPFRKRAWAAGAGLVVSEMIASAQLCFGKAESMVRLNGEGIGLNAVQLVGRDPHYMKEAAILAQENGADLIDINMGCPAKKVIGGFAGSALMRDVPLALELIKAVVKVARIPVTLKMRLGWDEAHRNAPELARSAEALGIAMVTVHGRTRSQLYKGKADWSALRAVRDSISIPLVVNGDIKSSEEAHRALDKSGADAIMLGRACYGAPWHVGELSGQSKPTNIPAYICQHYTEMLQFYGEAIGTRHARKHLNWYLTRHFNKYNAFEQQKILTETDPQAVLTKLNEIFARQGAECSGK